MGIVNEVKEALSAKSRTATLDELRSEGRRKVRLIRAEQVASMISEAVHAAAEQSGLISQAEVDKLVENSRREFKDILQQREREAQESKELKDQLQARDRELQQLRAQLQQQGGANAQANAAPGAQQAGPAGIDFAAALEKLTGSLNDRLEKLGKKMGVSAAVDAAELNFDGMFKDTGKTLESNMANIEIKKKEGGGIATNLAKLKKLKGGS